MVVADPCTCVLIKYILCNCSLSKFCNVYIELGSKLPWPKCWSCWVSGEVWGLKTKRKPHAKIILVMSFLLSQCYLSLQFVTGSDEEKYVGKLMLACSLQSIHTRNRAALESIEGAAKLSPEAAIINSYKFEDRLTIELVTTLSLN